MTDTEGVALLRRLDELAACSDQPGALTRLYLSPAHRRAADLVQGWMQQAGMAAEIDAIGNVVGRYAGQDAGAPSLLLGSHIDTVRDAGRYDGNLGVLAAIAVVDRLHATGTRLPFALEVLGFGDEEGVRFPATLAGSRAIAGTLDPAAFEMADEDGVPMRDALRDFGGDPLQALRLGRDPARTLAYVELHIEQGPVLERAGLPLGVVTAIAGASRFSVNVTGEAGHAGTVPMHMRRDALAAAAEMIGMVNRVGRETPGLVATVGHVAARPNAVNIIAAHAEFTIDLRSEDDTARAAAAARVRRALPAIAASHGTTLTVARTHDAPATPCALWLQEQLAAAVAAVGIPPRRLPSGAGHDAMAVASLCPIGMLFVRCRGGISHNPAESITALDATYALDALGCFLHSFDPGQSMAERTLAG